MEMNSAAHIENSSILSTFQDRASQVKESLKNLAKKVYDFVKKVFNSITQLFAIDFNNIDRTLPAHFQPVEQGINPSSKADLARLYLEELLPLPQPMPLAESSVLPSLEKEPSVLPSPEKEPPVAHMPLLQPMPLAESSVLPSLEKEPSLEVVVAGSRSLASSDSSDKAMIDVNMKLVGAFYDLLNADQKRVVQDIVKEHVRPLKGDGAYHILDVTKFKQKVISVIQSYKEQKRLKTKERALLIEDQKEMEAFVVRFADPLKSVLETKNRSATTIQTAMRGALARRKLSNLRQAKEEARQDVIKNAEREEAKLRRGAWSHGSAARDLGFAKTVVKLQAAFRGRKARKELEQKRRLDQAATKLQALVRAKNARRQFAKMKEQAESRKKMASSLQGAWKRGALLGRSAAEDIHKRQQEIPAAALKLQAAFRGMKARRKAASMRQDRQEKAATKLQSLYKGFALRKTIPALRKERSKQLWATAHRHLRAERDARSATFIQKIAKGWMTRAHLKQQQTEQLIYDIMRLTSSLSKEKRAKLNEKISFRFEDRQAYSIEELKQIKQDICYFILAGRLELAIKDDQEKLDREIAKLEAKAEEKAKAKLEIDLFAKSLQEGQEKINREIAKLEAEKKAKAEADELLEGVSTLFEKSESHAKLADQTFRRMQRRQKASDSQSFTSKLLQWIPFVS